MSPSYGYTYLTSYGWSGTGTGLRKGAIAKPLAIPPKKNLSGLGKDRDEAFPFWDHLFSAASKSITIKVSNGDEDGDETEDPSSHTDTEPVPLRRTTTGIISNRRPVIGTPASTSGSTTPNLDANANAPSPGAAGRLSLLAIAKRESAKRGLYARFFRGPVLGPDDDPCVGTTSHSGPSSSQSSVVSMPVPERVGGGQDTVVGETRKGKKRKSEDRVKTKEERRERKRLKRERKAARARKHSDEGTQVEENQTPKKARKQVRIPLEGLSGDELEQSKCTRRRLEEKLASTNGGQQDDIALHRPPSNVDATDAFNATKKKKENGKIPGPRHLSYVATAAIMS